MSPKKAKPEEELRFEDALEQLEGLVARLEAGESDLADSLRDFEEGVQLVRLCSDRLHAAELRLEQLEDFGGGTRSRAIKLEDGG